MDDILIIGNDHDLINELKEVLQKSFKIKELGDLKCFLGEEIARSNKGIALSQRRYALQLIADTIVVVAKTFKAQLEQNKKFTSEEYDDPFSMQHFIQFMQAPQMSHMETGKRVIQYVKDKPGMGLFFLAKHDDQLVAFCDSDWGDIGIT